ncbi:MAG TPA: AAA family ATPase [Thermoanaerobaculia bacterium]|nr:AAA family ATPase [Thermoanaerobaculia bacterium]
MRGPWRPPTGLAAALAARGARREGREVRFRCPAHADEHPSARWHPGKRTWFCDACKAGGGWRDLAARLGLEEGPAGAGGEVVATYPYRDAAGRTVYEVVRKQPKAFACRRPDGAGGWIWDLAGVERVLYRLPETLAAVARGETVFLTEGEKDAEVVAALGLAATTHCGGAGKWRREYAEALRGAAVVVLPDNDEAGRRHAAQVAASLGPVSRELRVLELPGLPEKGDVSDWIAAAGGAGNQENGAEAAGRLLAELAARAPVWPGEGGGEASAGGAGGGGAYRRMSEVACERVEFLWYPYIPLRKLTLLEGDPGQGKSWITAALAAAGSRGGALPGAAGRRGRGGAAGRGARGVGGVRGAREAFRTLFLTGEDGLGDTLRPRLERLGADCAQIIAHDRPVSLVVPGDVAELEGALEEHRPRLVVLDPIVAFLGARTDIYRANEVRAVLAPLGRLAERFDCAIVAVRHLNKVKGGRCIYAGQGSIDFAAAARSVLLAGCAADEPRERALVHIKSNLAPLGRACGYRIERGRFGWTGESSLCAADLLAAEPGAGDRGAREEAREFLRTALGGAARPAREVVAAAREAGIAERTLKRAKQKEGVEALRRGFGEGSVWMWRLPGAGLEGGARGVGAEAGEEEAEGGQGGEGGLTQSWPSSAGGPLRGEGSEGGSEEVGGRGRQAGGGGGGRELGGVVDDAESGGRNAAEVGHRDEDGDGVGGRAQGGLRAGEEMTAEPDGEGAGPEIAGAVREETVI